MEPKNRGLEDDSLFQFSVNFRFHGKKPSEVVYPKNSWWSLAKTPSGWWLNQPLWKNMLVKLDHFLNFRGENKKCLTNHHLDNIIKTPRIESSNWLGLSYEIIPPKHQWFLCQKRPEKFFQKQTPPSRLTHCGLHPGAQSQPLMERDNPLKDGAPAPSCR